MSLRILRRTLRYSATAPFVFQNASFGGYIAERLSVLLMSVNPEVAWSQKKMNPPKPLERRPRAPKRRIWIGLFLLVASVMMWFAGVPAALLHSRVSAQLANRDYEAAEDTLALIRTLGVSNPETVFWHARLNRKLLQVADVPGQLQSAAAGGFSSDAIRREFLLLQAQTGQIAEVMGDLKQMMVEPGADGAEICEAYTNGALIAGATDQAVAILPVWKADFPQDPQAHYAHARLLEFQGRMEQAVAELRLAISLRNTHWPSRYALGRILLGQNRVDEALSEFEAATAMRHNSAVLYQKARCCRALGRTEEAQLLLIEVVKLPQQEIITGFLRVGEPLRGLPIQFELGTLELSIRNYDAALKWLNQVLDSDPRNVDARYSRAIAMRELKQTEAANRDFSEVQQVRERLKEVDRLVDEINHAPDMPHLEKRCRVGELLLQYENSGRGELWLRETLARDPSFLPAHQLLAEHYAELAKTEPRYEWLAGKHRTAMEESSESKPSP